MIRIAICQIECHPAIYTADSAFLEEPYLPDGVSLGNLGMRGLPVDALQALCRQEYLRWQNLRLDAVLRFLEHLAPTPDLVLFPEGSIPIDSLTSLSQWSASTGSNILGGSHTPLLSADAKATYRAIGIRERRVVQPDDNRQVLPLIRAGKVLLIRKKLLSPFERSALEHALSGPPPVIEVASIQTGSGSIDVLPLICSEALQTFNIGGQPDLVAVISYDTKPSQFSPFFIQQTSNRRAAVYCNDGRFGGSNIMTVVDNRIPDWFRQALPTGLPTGDAIVVADLDLDVKAVEVGITTPKNAITWRHIASIVAENSRDGENSRSLGTIRQLPEAAARASELNKLLRHAQLNPLHYERVRHLHHVESRGVPCEELWEVLGKDCVIPGSVSLRALESDLANASSKHLINLFQSPAARNPEVAQKLVQYVSRCQTLTSVASNREVRPVTQAAPAIIDRDSEAREICSFLDDRLLSVLEVIGLEQVGKSALIVEALAQSGIKGVLHVPLSATSSAEYILYSLIRSRSSDPAPPYPSVTDVAKSEAIRQALAQLKVVVFHDSHFLFQGGTWRDTQLSDALKALVDTAESLGVKIIFEGRRPIASDLVAPTSRKPLRVQGLSGPKKEFGVALFDAQLRRVGLAPNSTEMQQKIAIVEKLGGHPVAIALAADIYYEEGLEGLQHTLGQRSGSVFRFVDSLVRSLDLGSEAYLVLALLGQARGPIPRSVILNAAPFPAAPVLRDLVLLGCIEVTSDAHIEIAGIIRDYFDITQIDPAVIKKFHSAAAEAFEQMAQASAANVSFAVEAEYHAGVAGVRANVASNLIDGALATALQLYDRQDYDRAAIVVEALLARAITTDTLRLAAQVEMRRSQLEKALAYAKEVFRRNPSDTELLTQLARIALTQHQSDRVAKDLVEIAKRAGVEDVSILVVEGRLLLREGKLSDAEGVFKRAVQRTERNPWPYFYLGQTYMRLGRLEEAIGVLHEGQEFTYKINSTRRAALNAIEAKLGLAYLFSDRVDLAAPIIDNLIEVNPESPEVIQAYAALTIRREGVDRAHEALAKLSKARIRGGFERCQFHLIYGLFYLGIKDPHRAAIEFEKAHAADRANVFVMMNWARTLYELASARWADGDDVYKTYVDQCAELVEEILRFDPDNPEGVSLMNALHQRFGKDIG